MKIQTLREIKSQIIDHYLSEDGLLLLKKDNQKPPHNGQTLKTSDNDNGILFVTYFYFLLNHHKLLEPNDSIRFYDSVKRLELKPGLYLKNPGRLDRHSSHDDYIGIIAGSKLFNFSFQKDILDFGIQNGFLFSHQTKHDIKRFRLGSDISLYKIANNKLPTPWHILWLIGHIFFNTFQSFEKDSSSWLLTWLRLKTIDMAKRNIYSPFLDLAKQYWLLRLNQKTNNRGLEMLINIYFKNHEIVKLAKDVKY